MAPEVAHELRERVVLALLIFCDRLFWNALDHGVSIADGYSVLSTLEMLTKVPVPLSFIEYTCCCA